MHTNRTRKSSMRAWFVVLGLSLILLSCISFPSQAQGVRMVDLAPGADLTIVGREAGEAVSAPSPGSLTGDLRVISADVSGDGVSDLIISLPLAGGPPDASARAGAGRVYVILGQRGMPPRTIKDLQRDPPAVTIFGAGAGDKLGAALAAGDINGDGVKDVIIGAPRAEPSNTRPDVGQAYVIFGGQALTRSSTRDMASSSTGPDVTLIGWGGLPNQSNIMDDQDQAGTSVAAGDVNGDGLDDVIVGAPGQDGPDGKRSGEAGVAPDGGAVYVFFGSRNLRSGTVRDASKGLPDGGVNMVIYGRTTKVKINAALRVDFGESLGTSVVAADVNMDGRADVIAGAPNFSPGGNDQRAANGAVYVVLGPARSLTDPPVVFDTASTSSAPNMSIVGADSADSIGTMLAAGDINGDMKADIIIPTSTASGPSNARTLAGEVHVIFGANPLPASRDLATTAADLAILGAEAGDRLGFSVAVGSVGGDAVADLIIGAPTADGLNNSRPSSGEVEVVFGKSTLRGTIDLGQPNQGPDVTIMGAEFADQVGFSVAAGDINGDGTADVIASSPFASSSGLTQETRLGLTFVVFGSK